MKSVFDKWFKAQFGSLPEEFDVFEIQKQLNAAELRVSSLKAQLREATRISDQYRAASYAKNAAAKKWSF